MKKTKKEIKREQKNRRRMNELKRQNSKVSKNSKSSTNTSDSPWGSRRTERMMGVKPSVPKTSNELREMNEIKTEVDGKDLYKNIYFLDWKYEGQVIWSEEEGEFLPHGYGKEVFINVTPVYDGISSQEKEVSYEGGFKNGKRDGYGIVVLNTGSTWEGSFKNGKRHGWGYSNYKSSHNFISSGEDLIEVRCCFEKGEQVGTHENVYEDGLSVLMSERQRKSMMNSFQGLSKDELKKVQESFLSVM